MLAKRVLFILTAFTLSTPSNASFLDYMRDSLNNIDTNLAFKYYSTQERGYFLGGSWHYRYPRFTIYPFTFTPPSIKWGCGGIDIVMGGFSYLQPEYLVQKFQQMLQAAPAVAFEIALDSYAPQIKTILNELDNLANQINSLNFDSCTAIRGITAYIEKNIIQKKESSAGNAAAQEQASGTNEGFFSSIQDWYEDFQNKIKKFVNSLKGEAIQNEKGQRIDIDTVSVIEDALASTKIGSNQKIAALVRCVIGDINIRQIVRQAENNKSGTGYIPPSAKVTEEFLTEWLSGKVRFVCKDRNGNNITITFDSIKRDVMNDLNELYKYMINGQKPPNPSKYLYLTYSDLPTIATLKMLSAINDPVISDVVNDQIADLITMDVVYGTFKAVVKAVIEEAQDLVKNLQNQYAQFPVLTEELKEDMKKLLDNYYRFNLVFSQTYYNLRKQRQQQILRFITQYKQLLQIVNRRVAEVIPVSGG